MRVIEQKNDGKIYSSQNIDQGDRTVLIRKKIKKKINQGHYYTASKL